MDQKLIWRLAYRYLRGKRLGNAVPVLSRISMVAIAVSSAAMIVIFSVFNGLESVVKAEYKGFYPDIKITAARGKFFTLDNTKLDAIKHISGVSNTTASIEDNVLVISNDEQIPVTLKGITGNYFEINDIRDSVTGADSVSAPRHTAILGMHIANVLGADINNVFSTINLFYINTKIKSPTDNPAEAYQSLKLCPAGIFNVSEEFDEKYILAPLPLVQELFNEKGNFSSIEIKADANTEVRVKEALQKLLGSTFRVETRYEQNRTLYRVMGTEKWAVYAILVLVLLIASFNMVGALSMLVLEKQKDIAILRAMGALPGTIRKIFLLEGLLWSVTGGLSGILIGAAVCLAQERFSIIKMDGSFVVSAYPVALEPADIALVLLTIISVGLLTSWYPAMRAARTIDPSLKAA